MADDADKLNGNFKHAVFGISSDGLASIIIPRFDPTTKRLLVDASISSATITDIEDGAGDSIMDAANNAMRVNVVTGGSGGTQYAEDAAHASGDTGTLALVVRKDTAAQIAGTDGDYTALITDANGRLHVLDANSAAIKTAVEAIQTSIAGTLTVGSHAVTNAGTFVVQVDGAALTALQLIDNLVLLEDVAHQTGDPGVQMLAIRDDTLDARSGTENDYEPLHTNANGALWVIDVNSASALTSLQLIDDVVYTDDTGTHSTGSSKGILMMAAATPTDTAVNANDIGALAMTLNRELLVQVNTALPAGANAIGKLAANSGVDIGDIDVTSIVPGTAATNLGKAEDAGHTTGDVGVMMLSVRQNTAAALSGSDADYQPLITDTNGRLHVIDVNSASMLTSLQLIDDPVIADDAAFTPATSKVMMAGFEADETSTDSVDEGDAGAARMTLDRKIIVTVQPHTAGGWDTFIATSSDGATALTSTAQAVKASAGKLGGWYIYNPNSAATYVHFYNVAAASVTVGTTNPKMTLVIPATSAANLELVNGISFDTAIAISATTTGGGNTAPSTALEANVFYK